MDKINWSNFDYDNFEMFCNALLSFEIGKAYQPFSAAGVDGGIDGFFSGTYLEMTGKWRFQFKFSQTPRSTAVSNLKGQIKEEATKLKDENFFVLITNVELLPQENSSLVDIFENQMSNLGKDCKCLIWDGAKIYTIFLQYPILELWLNEGFRTAQLQDYRLTFKQNITLTNFEPSTFSSIFISRNKEIEKLNNFLDAEAGCLALITGEAGIGKTRLVFEFFNQVVNDSPRWIPLVLINKSVAFDKLRKALSGDLNYVILIDDAHNYKPEIISDIKTLAESLSNQVKIILTARTLDAFTSLELIKEYEATNMLHIKLDELSRTETEEMFNHYLSKSAFRHYIAELILISYGKPILIIALLNAIVSNISISQIREQNFLRKYVSNYFDSYVNKVVAVTNVSILSARRLLQNIVLIEPFNFNDSAIITTLSNLHGIKLPETKEALRLLSDNGFVDGRFEQSVKPDYYSDILLSEIDENEVLVYISEFENLVDNIIVNLSSVDEIRKKDSSVFLDSVLHNYVVPLETASSVLIVQKILETVSNISLVKPQIAKLTIEICIKCLGSESHPLTISYLQHKKFADYQSDNVVNSINSILTKLYNNPKYLDFVYTSSFKLFGLIEESKLSNIFKFSKNDFIEQFDLTRTNYFIEEFSRKADHYNEKELKFGLLCLGSFLNLEFNSTEWDAVTRNSLRLTTYYLPSSPTVKKMRSAIIQTLINLYSKPNALILKSEILKQIIDVPRGIFATSRNATQYSNDTEIKNVLIFLKDKSNNFDMLEQKEILDKIYWFQKWGISENLNPLIDEVREALKPKNLTETLSQLFSKAEIKLLDMNNVEKYVADRCDEIVLNSRADELANSIIEFLSPQQYPPHYYFSFQNALEQNYPDYAKVLHDTMLEIDFKIYCIYGWRILSTLYFKHHDELYYWENVRKLQAMDISDADNVLLSIYGDRVPGMTSVSSADTDVIIKIFLKGRNENYYRLSMALQMLFAAKHPDALAICIKYLDHAPQRETEMFFIRLSDNTTVELHHIQELILKHTVRFDITYEIEHCLNILMLQKKEDEIFNYLMNRFLFKKNIVITKRTLSEYDFVPDGKHSRLFDQCDPILKVKMYFKALDWYLTVDNDGGHLYYAKDLLKYLQPSEALDAELMAYYLELLKNARNDGESFERILQSLSIFHVKDDFLFQTIINAYEYVLEFKKNDESLYEDLRTECYLAITTMGVKSGPANSPFQVDLDLEALVMKYINSVPTNSPIDEFLKSVLASVQADINRFKDRDNYTW